MSDCAAVGALAKLLIEPGASPHTFDSNSEAYPFLYETLATNRTYGGTRAIYGTRTQPSARLYKKAYIPIGRLALQPGPADLDLWLPRILGGAKTGNNIDPAETLPSFGALISRDNGIFQYNDCIVGDAIFQGSGGQSEGEEEAIDLVMTIMAKAEIGPSDPSPPSWPVSPPAIPTGATRVPYVFNQGVLTAGSNARAFDRFVLSINNMVRPRWRNSITPTCLIPFGRQVNLQVVNPFLTATESDAFGLYSTGMAGSLKFTSGNASIDFQFPDLRNFYKTPTVRGKGEIPIELNLQAFNSAATTYEIRAVNDSTV